MSLHETFRCEYVRCGKASCKRCPHGPYWYAYSRPGAFLKKRYVGKDDPRGNRGNYNEPSSPGPGAPPRREASPPPPLPPPPPPPPPNPWDRIFNRETASKALALEILGLVVIESKEDLDTKFKKWSRKHHPDRGGDTADYQRGEAAYSYLKSARSWR